MATKKVSLKGRKRTADLTDSVTVSEQKKAELLAMKKAEQQSDLSHSDSEILQSVDQKSSNPDPKSSKSSKPSKSFQSKPLDIQIGDLVEFHRSLIRAGTAQRREYSTNQVREKMKSKLCEIINIQAEYWSKEGLSHSENHTQSQKYLDQLLKGLVAAGVELGELKLTRKG